MAKWSYRSGIYKVTLIAIYFVFCVYGLAFSIPTWFGGVGSFMGLWMRCMGDDTADLDDCSENSFGEDNSDWMDGVRGVWVGGMFFFLMAIIYSLMENFCGDEEGKDYGLTGTLVILAGACGAAGVIVVAVKLEDGDGDPEYYWGFILACIASGLALILAVVLLITRNAGYTEKSRASRTADYVFAHKTGPYTTEYINQGYNRDDIPVANGVTYQHTPAQPYTMYPGGSQNGIGYTNNSLPRPRGQGMYNQPQGGYQPYGYDMGRPNQRHSMAESADLSNGYTSELIHAEHTLSRPSGPRGDFGRGGDYARNDFAQRNDYYLNGSRPY